ncbi:hypothetical protein OAT05_04355, partial [Candidatus Pelagibacter sp.]|nr:hypothetical protein [Candidatus Pelagibacter sp.]
NIFFSYLKWYFYAFISLINSQIYFVKIITLFFFKNIKIDKESVNFCSFPSNKIENINSRNEFFLNHFIEKFKIKKIYHDNRELLNNTKFNSVSLIQNINHIRLFSLLNLFKFITFNILLVFLSLVLFTFKQDLAIMMKEILKSYLFYIEKKNYSKIYLFNNSDGIYRPLWSYLKNKKITTYYFFLGQSCMPFDDDNPNDIKKFRLNFASNYYGLEFLSWQNYLFWNEFQCLSYKKNLIDKKINFYLDRFVETNYKSISNNYNSKSLSFFDITPYDKIFAIKRLAPTYHNFKNLNIMFNDILEICNDLNIHILYKSKRYKEKIHDIKYQKFLESINKIKNVTVYEEEFSSYSILKSSKIAICSPFTSVGVIANTLKIKTAYYDLSDVNYKEMVAFENLPIIKNKHVLREWIKKNINKYEK